MNDINNAPLMSNIAPISSRMNDLTFMITDTHLGDWMSGKFEGSYWDGIAQINKEHPNIKIAPWADVWIPKIKKASLHKKAMEQIWKAEYKVRGQIIGGTRRTYQGLGYYKGNELFYIIINAGIIIRLQVGITGWGVKTYHYKPKKLDPIDQEYRISLKLGDYIEFPLLLVAHYYADGMYFWNQHIGKISNLEPIAEQIGAFITLSDIKPQSLDIKKSNLKEEDFLSKQHPDFKDIEMPS